MTPPKRDGPECREDGSKDREEFDSKSWHESNRIFAAKYFRENSAFRANPEGRSEMDREPSPETGMQEFREGNEMIEEAKAETHGFGNGEQRPRVDLEGRYASTRERNGATIIRIRSSPEEMPAERRRGRRLAQDSYAARRRRYEAEEDEEDSGEDEAVEEEEEEEEVEEEVEVKDVAEDHRGQRGSRGDGCVPGRGVSTPSRRVWNYREGVWHFHESIAFDRSFMVQKREAIFINRWRR